MRTLIIFTLFLLGTLLLASLLAYPALSTFALDIESTRWSKNVGKLFAILGFFPLLAWLHLNTRQALGISGTWRQAGSGILRGFGLGLGLMLPLALLLILIDLRVPVDASLLPERLLKGLVSGLVGGLIIGVIEELYFRGAIWQHSRRHHNLLFALLIGALYYAAVHFIRFEQTPHSPDLPFNVAWWQGAIEFARGLAQYPNVFDSGSFAALLAFGLLLGILRHSDTNIWRCIGTHAAVVMIIRILKTSTETNEIPAWSWLVGSYDHIIGWLAACWFLVLFMYQLRANEA